VAAGEKTLAGEAGLGNLGGHGKNPGESFSATMCMIRNILGVFRAVFAFPQVIENKQFLGQSGKMGAPVK